MDFKPVSKKISILAILLYLVSLTLPGFIDRAGGSISSLNILAIGWLGLIALNPAWFANIFFMKGSFTLLFFPNDHQSPAISAVLAVLLSLNALWFRSIPDSDLSKELFAFGLGGFIWIIANMLLLLAAHTREVEIAKNRNLTKSDLISSPGFITISGLTVIFISIIAYFGINDRMTAQGKDKLYMKLAAFSYVNLCDQPYSVTNDLTRLKNGIVQINIEDENLEKYHFSPSFLLNSGIPKVRKNGLEYSLVENKANRMIITIADDTQADLLLEAGWSTDKNRNFSVKIMDSLGNLVLEEHYKEWPNTGYNSTRYCPDININKLLLGYLLDRNGKKLRHAEKTKGYFKDPIAFYQGETIDIRKKQARSQFQNLINCPEDSRLNNTINHATLKGIPVYKPAHWVFVHNERMFGINLTQHDIHGTCVGEDILFYWFSIRDDPNEKEFILYVDKYNSDYMEHKWDMVKAIVLPVKNGRLPIPSDIEILDVDESGKKHVITMAYYLTENYKEEGQLVKVRYNQKQDGSFKDVTGAINQKMD